MWHRLLAILLCLLLVLPGFSQEDDDDYFEDEFVEETEADDDSYDEEDHVPIGIPLRADPSKHKLIPLEFLWSQASDIAPALSPDGRYIIFQSNRDNDERFSLYETIRKRDKTWLPPRRISLHKDASFDGQPFFSGRRGHIYYTSVSAQNYKKAEEIDIATDIWFTRFKRGKWSKPRHLPAPINSADSELTPWVSYDGRKMFFASNRPGGYGGYDIWVTDRENNTWGEPYNLGPAINSGGDEIYPRIHPDNSVLYFSSNRAGGVGGYDIYLSRRYGNRWKKSENAGSFINTRSNEFLNSIPASSKYIYMSRGDVGEEKIYQVTPIPEFMKPSSVVIARLVVIEKGNNIPQPFKIEIKNVRTGEIILQKKYQPENTEPYRENVKAGLDSLAQNYFSKTGLFVSLPKPGTFNLFITSKRHLFVDSNIKVTEGTEDELKKVYFLTPLKVGSTIALKNIYFFGNKATMKDESKKRLLRVARYLTNNPHIAVELRGHTARVGRGSRRGHLRLSRERARAVRTALIEYGIEAKRLKARGFGARRPLYGGSDPRNRRVEFVVSDLLLEKNKKMLRQKKREKRKQGKKRRVK